MVRKEGVVMTNSHSETYDPNPSLGEEELAVHPRYVRLNVIYNLCHRIVDCKTCRLQLERYCLGPLLKAKQNKFSEFSLAHVHVTQDCI
jgi:hypothetical protein